MTRQKIKSILLKIPAVKRYVEATNKIRNENVRLTHEIENQATLISQSRSPSLFKSSDDFLTERLLSHPANSLNSTLTLSSESARHIETRVEVAERLIKAYHKALADEANSPLRREGEDLWTGLLRNELPELLEAIDSHDAVKLANFLANFGNSYVWFGGITTCIDGFNKDLRPESIALTYHDKLISLAESLGVLRHESPESGPWGENMLSQPEDVLNGIAKKIGIDIHPPMGIIHTDGIKVGKSILHYRHINALYSALRLHALNKNHESVCEFGGGLGMTAMYSLRLGVKDYTIFDLPITCLLAGHYLIHAIGPEKTVLYGEENKEDSVKLLPYWECQKQAENRFAFALNQDSFPEISDNLILEYLSQIKRNVSNGFLSINHECFAPRTVLNFTRQSGGFKLLHRSKCWVRDGYVEEFYTLGK